MISLRRMDDADKDALMLLKVSEEQSAFVDPIAHTLSTVVDHCDNHVIIADGNVVGFFQIHCMPSENLVEKTLHLEELSIGLAHQGKGYGTQLVKLLKPYLSSEYPDWPAVRLGVNFRNEKAYGLYLKGGFVDTGDVDHSGRSGPQHVMTMSLS